MNGDKNMNRIICATLSVGLFIDCADALKRCASSFESIGRATLSSSISQSNSKQLISLLTQKDVKMLVAHDDELLEITAEKASSLAPTMSTKEKAQMRIWKNCKLFIMKIPNHLKMKIHLRLPKKNEKLICLNIRRSIKKHQKLKRMIMKITVIRPMKKKPPLYLE